MSKEDDGYLHLRDGLQFQNPKDGEKRWPSGTMTGTVVTDGPGAVPQRKYLPTLSDLVDRLAIVQMKAIFIPERAAEYAGERRDIEHDIDLILAGCPRIDAKAVHAILVIMLANRFIWENESKAREGSSEQDGLLKLTHSINGVRNTAKNQLAAVVGGRKDYKIDALAADLPEEFGNWRVFE